MWPFKIEKKVKYDDKLQQANEALYRHSLELAEKNRTFLLLRKLYDISILTLTPTALSQKITLTLREELNFELVGILLFDSQKNEYFPLSFSTSERLKKVEIECEKYFGKTHISEILLKEGMLQTENLKQVWGDNFNTNTYSKIKGDGHVKSIIVYPLFVEGRKQGIMVMCFNRSYDSLTTYEKESISSFVEVTAVALDKALLYTELKISNKKLEDANIRLQELDQQKTEFISLATHQIRGPLGAIKGHASLALEGDYGPLEEGPKKAFDTIMKSAQALVVIVNDYLDVSRIEQGKMKYDNSEFDLKDLAKDVVTEFFPAISNRPLTLDFNCDQTLTYKVFADMGKIKQVMSNLLDNSLKYTPTGHIRVNVEKKDGKILFSVKDSGVGIKPDVIPHLFAKFSRAPEANKTNILGTGLGLFVAKKMVEAHNGRIWAESAGENSGSQFYVELDEIK